MAPLSDVECEVVPPAVECEPLPSVAECEVPLPDAECELSPSEVECGVSLVAGAEWLSHAPELPLVPHDSLDPSAAESEHEELCSNSAGLPHSFSSLCAGDRQPHRGGGTAAAE